MRVWPLAALVVYLAPVGTFPYHAFQGLAIPLVDPRRPGRGVSVWPRPRAWIVVAALAVMIAARASPTGRGRARRAIHAAGDPYFVFPGEQRALDALEADPRPGGVLGPAYAGHMLPYKTGREVYVGALSWTPDWDLRVRLTQTAVRGRHAGGAGAPLRARDRRALHVRRLPAAAARPRGASCARCSSEVRRFGCATLYVLRRHPGTVLTGD